MGEVMLRSLINFVAIVCVLVAIDSDMKLLGIGGFCNAQEMDDNGVEQMWIGYMEELEEISDDYHSLSGWSGFPRRSLRDKRFWHQVLPPASASTSSPMDEAVLPIFTPASTPRAPASSPLLGFESPPNKRRLLKSVFPLPNVHPPPIRPHTIPPMPRSPPLPMPKIHPPPMPRSRRPPMPRSLRPPMSRSRHPPMPRSPHPPMPKIPPPPMPRSLRPPMPRNLHPPMPKIPPPPMPRSLPPPMPRSRHPPMPKIPPAIPRSLRPPMPRSLRPPMPRSHHPSMPGSLRPSMPRSRHPPMPKIPPPPMPRSLPPPMPRSLPHPMPKIPPPPAPRSPPPVPRNHPPLVPRSHPPPMPRSRPPPMPRSPFLPMPRSPPHLVPKSPLPPMPKSPLPMPKTPHPSPLNPPSSPLLSLESPNEDPLLKAILTLPIVHPPPIRPHIIPPMPKFPPPPMPKSPPPPMPKFPPPPMPKSPPPPRPKSPPPSPLSPSPMPKSPPPSPLSPSPMPKSPPPSPPSPPPRRQDFDHVPSKDDHDDKKKIVSAVAGGTVGGITLVALILICFVKKRNKEGQEHEEQTNGTNVTDGTNGHVLNLSSTDHISAAAAGAKQMPQSNENPPGDVKELKTSSTLDTPSVTPDMKKDIHTSTPSATETKTPELSAAKSASPPRPPPKLPAQGPPPPPKGAQPPPPPKGGHFPAPPKSLAPNTKGRSSGAGSETGDSSKAKLKPFFWDKVNTSPNRTMVWHEIKSGSFEVNEEKMESLFGYSTVDKNQNVRKKDVTPFDAHFIQIIDARKAQNLAILLKALNLTTEEVCDALKEGNELPFEFVQTLLKMAPTEEEELKLRLFTGDISELAPADRFLKVLVSIPFAFKRMESLLFMTVFQEEISSVKQSLATLEVASKELSNSRLFLKLLEAVLKTGNRMNDGTFRGGAAAFKLDTLLKLSDVKGTDGKTTLLHFVVQEVSRSEGLKSARRLKQCLSLTSVRTEDCVDEASRKESAEYYQSLGLQVVSRLSNELENVKKAAVIDRDNLTQSVAKLKHSLSKARDFLENDIKNLEGEKEFRETLENFLNHAGEEITRQVEEEKRIMEMVKSTGDYFHGKTGKDEGIRLFVIVRDFLVTLDKVCKEVGDLIMKPANTPSGKGESQNAPSPEIPLQLFSPFKPQQAGDDGFSSDDESSSP